MAKEQLDIRVSLDGKDATVCMLQIFYREDIDTAAKTLQQ